MSEKAIVNGRVIDGTGRTPIESGVVLVDDDEIVAVGKREEISVPPEAEQMDATGKTVMPGLMDGHIHITKDSGIFEAIRDDGDHPPAGSSPEPLVSKKGPN